MMATNIYLFCLALLAFPCWSYRSYQDVLPNGNNVNHPCKVNYRWPGLGHNNPLGGGERNAFGADFRSIGNGEWNTALCRADSDGDGRTNGEELGDPNCVWRPGQIPMTNQNISHPGVCEPVNSPNCRGKVDFVDCEVETFKDCAAIKNPQVKSFDARFPRVEVPDTETNYFCMSFDLPTDQDYHLVAHEPIIDNADVVHHILVYGCKSNNGRVISEPEQCFMSQSDNDCEEIIGLWTVGVPGTCLPPNLGFRFGASGYARVRLETHYNNPGLRSDYTDASGLRLYYQPAEPQFQDLYTMTTGQRILEIPPGKAWVPQVGVCPADCTRGLITKPAFIYSAFNHMHYLGRSMKIELFRNGVLINNLTNEDFYSYDNPVEQYFSPAIQLLPGDEIRTTCVFNSLSTNRWTYFGQGTSDEMCLGFLILYPKDALVDQASCLAFGPLSFCSLFTREPISGCEWSAFLNKTHPDTKVWWNDVEKNCNYNGFCRPECRETVTAVKQHPCMTSDMKHTVEWLLAQSYEGRELLARLSSCPGDQCTPEQCPGNCDGWTDVRDNAEFLTMGFISLFGAAISTLVLGIY